MGECVWGIWHEPPRHVPGKVGKSGYYLGAIRDPHTGYITGITLPQMLERQLLDLPVGSGVRITFLGSVETSMGYQMYKFDVQTWPPAPAAVPQ